MTSIKLQLEGDDLIKFIKSYKEKECLWNTQCKDYKNIMFKIKAYNRLSQEFTMSGLHVKQLINALHTLYSREWKKLIDSSINDDYQPKFTWYNEMDFIDDILFAKRENHNIDYEHNYVEYLCDEEDYSVPQYPSADAMNTYLGGTGSNETLKISPKRSHSDVEIDESSSNESTAVSTSINYIPNEEIDYFCTSLASQMFKLPVRSLIQLQMEIQNLVSRKRLEEFQSFKRK